MNELGVELAVEARGERNAGYGMRGRESSARYGKARGESATHWLALMNHAKGGGGLPAPRRDRLSPRPSPALAPSVGTGPAPPAAAPCPPPALSAAGTPSGPGVRPEEAFPCT